MFGSAGYAASDQRMLFQNCGQGAGDAFDGDLVGFVGQAIRQAQAGLLEVVNDLFTAGQDYFRVKTPDLANGIILSLRVTLEDDVGRLSCEQSPVTKRVESGIGLEELSRTSN